MTIAAKQNISNAYCQRSRKIMFSKPALKGTINPRGPPVSESAWLAITNATSLKASVAMAKNGPRSRKVGHEISVATSAAMRAMGRVISHGDQPKRITNAAVK
jgi:hypothetical protein